MRFLYTLAVYLAAPLVSVILLLRGLRDRAYWQRFPERFGFGELLPTPNIWVHAVSVGEVHAAVVLVTALRKRHPTLPVVVTTFTPTGATRARALLKECAYVRYLPFDLPGSVRRFFRRVQPRIAVIFETEVWPNLYHECGRRRIPLVLASARLSARSVSRYRKLGGLFRDTLARGTIIAAQGEGDADRFREAGADPDKTQVTGNIKFDFSVSPETLERGVHLRQQFGSSRPVWVAGSTHTGEDERVLEAHRLVRDAYPDALLVLAPRHPARFGEVADRLQRAGVPFVRRSQQGVLTGATATPSPQVLLLDTLGELLDFYACGDVAFVGGSLVPIGGHNLLEPAALGKPILTGPYNSNSEDVARLLVGRGAAEIVNDGRELGKRVAALLAAPDERARLGELARASIDSNRGALGKLLAIVEPLL